MQVEKSVKYNVNYTRHNKFIHWRTSKLILQEYD